VLSLALNLPENRPFNILCFGAHSDDIEIGAGGMILSLLGERSANVHWVVLSAHGRRAEEARASATDFLSRARTSRIDVHDLRDGFFPIEFERLKGIFEQLKRETMPDLILTHALHDHHQDHRTTAEVTWNTFRDHLILGYEIPKYDPDIGNPNVFVPLTSETAEQKVAMLMKHFVSQQTRRWFKEETFRGIMHVRGLQAAAPSGIAEAFYGPKICLDESK